MSRKDELLQEIDNLDYRYDLGFCKLTDWIPYKKEDESTLISIEEETKSVFVDPFLGLYRGKKNI